MNQDQVSQLLAAMPAETVSKIDWTKVIEIAAKFLPVILALLQEVTPKVE